MSEQISIRTATPNDLEVIYGFICDLEQEELNFEDFREIFLEYLNSRDWLCLLACRSHEILGFMSFHTLRVIHHAGAVGEIQEFYVKPESRNMGIGRILVSHIKAFAREKKLKRVEVATNRKRTQNVAIYEALGFKTTHHKFTL